jgi:hypothetical protein
MPTKITMDATDPAAMLADIARQFRRLAKAAQIYHQTRPARSHEGLEWKGIEIGYSSAADFLECIELKKRE